MTYSVKTTDNIDTITVATGEVSTKYGVALVGRNVSGYGQFFVQNTLWMLENFASSSSPVARGDTALVGQHWYHSTENTMRVYDGGQWRRQTPLISSSAPTTDLGDGTSYFDTVDNKERIYAGTTWQDVSYPGTITSRWSAAAGGATSFGTRTRTLYLTDSTNNKRAVTALVYVNDGTSPGYTTNETIMAIFSDYGFTILSAGSVSDVYRDSESASVNMYAEFTDANGIGLEIKPGMNLRKAYSETSVPLADLANVAHTAQTLTAGATEIQASAVFHTGSASIAPPVSATDTVNLGESGARWLNAYLGGSIVLGDGDATDTVTHTIKHAGGLAKLSVGTSTDPVTTLYVEDIHMNGNIIGLSASAIDTLGSDTNPMNNAYISNVFITTGASAQTITTNGVKGLNLQKTDGTVVFNATTGAFTGVELDHAITDGDGIATFSYNGGVADTVAVDNTVIRTTGIQTLGGAKTFDSETTFTSGINSSTATVKFGSLSDGAITITQFVDEDTMSSNSATQIPTQQSVKTYVDTQITSNTTGDIAPAVTNTSSLGSASFKYANVHATTFTGVATSAQYADMAEIYSADADYEAGTVVKIGGDAEITMTTDHADTDVFGVISTAPAYLMNSEAEGLPVALSGRVPVKVIGKIKKGQRLVSSDIPGVAWASMEDEYDPRAIVGRSLEDKNDGGEGTVEAVIGVR